MAKKIRRIFAICLAMCLFVTVLPFHALAADHSETTTETSTEGGLTTTVETTTTTTTDENGNTTVVVEIVKVSTAGTEEDGTEISSEETTTITSEYDEKGNLIGYTESLDGKENTEWSGEPTPDHTDLPKVEIDLIPGETVTGTASGETGPETVETANGTVTTETSTDRTVTVTTSKIETSEVAGDLNMNPIIPEDYEGKTNVSDTISKGFGPNRTGVPYIEIELLDDGGNVVLDDDGAPIMLKIPDPTQWDESWDYQYFESGERSSSGSLYTTQVVFYRDEEGNLILDENGKPTYKTTGYPNPHPNTSFGRQVGSYMNVLWDKEGNLVYTYCIDKDQGQDWGQGYVMENLDECNYFPTEEANDRIRAIALNGYWGVESGTGSLSQMKDSVSDWINGEEEICFTVGNVTYNNATEEGRAQLQAMIDAMNEGDVLNSTQAAIWSVSDGTILNLKGTETSSVFMGFNMQSGWGDNFNKNDPNPENGGAAARMWLAYHYLMALEPIAKNETDILNHESFLEEDGLNLVIGDKLEDTADDENGIDHDVYNADLSFTMVVAPSTENGDDLVVMLFDHEGNLIRKARIAGDGSNDDETFTAIEQNGSTYTFKDLQLTENTDIVFDLRLEGIQNLGEGVYVYKAIGEDNTTGYKTGQAMLGISSGEQEVCIDSKFTLNFSVEEDHSIVTSRIWQNEYTAEIDPPEEEEEDPIVPDDNEEDPPAPVFEVNVDGEDAVVILDEDVPLADAPKTGSNAILWVALAIFSALGMAATRFTTKKQHETF